MPWMPSSGRSGSDRANARRGAAQGEWENAKISFVLLLIGRQGGPYARRWHSPGESAKDGLSGVILAAGQGAATAETTGSRGFSVINKERHIYGISSFA